MNRRAFSSLGKPNTYRCVCNTLAAPLKRLVEAQEARGASSLFGTISKRGLSIIFTATRQRSNTGAKQPWCKVGTQLGSGRKPPCRGFCLPHLLGCPCAPARAVQRIIPSSKLGACRAASTRQSLPSGWSSEGNSFQSPETMAN